MSERGTASLLSGRGLPRQPGLHPVHIALLGVAALTLFRLWYCNWVELVPDEGYYWIWSKHLAASYRDKGPGIAWAIALGTSVFGDTVLGIRVVGVLLSAGTAWQLFRLARRLYDDQTALWCLGVALVMPLFAVGAILMTIDSLSVFFWAWALNLFWSALESGKMRYWVLLGLAIGLGFLAKFTNGVQLVCMGLFLLWSKPHRHYLFSRQTVAMLGAFGICSLPILIWNLETGWVHALALHSRSGAEGAFTLRPMELLRFLGEHAGVVSPPLMIGIVVAAIGLARKQSMDLRVRFLLCQFVPLYAVFTFFSLNHAGKPNWPAPALVAGIVLFVVFWRDLTARRPPWRWSVYITLGLALVITLVLHLAAVFPILPRLMDPMRRAQGWPSFAEHVQQARRQTGIGLLLADHYAQASMMRFYLPDHPITYLPKAPYGSSQFTLWPNYDLKAGTQALYVTDNTGPLPRKLQEEFGESRLLDDFWSVHRGRASIHFRIYVLTHH
jgi:4-amino-4-deoxy-L-arabinose transferase-like glycosyltransferase